MGVNSMNVKLFFWKFPALLYYHNSVLEFGKCKIKYSTGKSIRSAFLDPKAGSYLQGKRTSVFKRKVRKSFNSDSGSDEGLDGLLRHLNDPENVTEEIPEASEAFKLRVFCSEFVIKCYQEALSHLDKDWILDEIRALDIRGDACTPMCFEGFIKKNILEHRDWKAVGTLRAEYL